MGNEEMNRKFVQQLKQFDVHAKGIYELERTSFVMDPIRVDELIVMHNQIVALAEQVLPGISPRDQGIVRKAVAVNMEIIEELVGKCEKIFPPDSGLLPKTKAMNLRDR